MNAGKDSLLIMNKKAIKIDLSIFFDDERKWGFVLVDPNWKSVECLQRRVELLFDVSSVRFLSDGCFLPPQESIEILYFCNNIKAFVPKESPEVRKKKEIKKCKNIQKSSKKSENEETPFVEFEKNQIDDIKKKRKSLCMQSPSGSSYKPKRSKNGHVNSVLETTNAKDEMALKRSDVASDEVESKMSKTKNGYISILTADYQEFEEENQSCGPKTLNREKCIEEETLVPKNFDDQHKQRRTSTPKENKRSKHAENDLEKTFNDEMKTTSASPSSIASSTFISESKIAEQSTNAHRLSKPSNPKNPFKKPKSSGSHIYFNEADEIVNSTPKAISKTTQKSDKGSKRIITFRCPLSDVTNGIESQKPRIFHLKSKNVINSTTKKQIVEIKEDIILPPHSFTISRNILSLTNDETATSNFYKQKVVNGSNKETDSTNENSSLNNISIATATTTISNNDEEKQGSVKDLEVPHKEQLNVIETQAEFQVEITNNDIDVTETQTESEMGLTHIGGDVTETQNKLQDVSQTEIKNIDGNVADVESKTQIEQKNIDETSISLVDCVDLSVDVDEVANLTESEISEIIDLNESEDNCIITASTQQNSTAKHINIKEILPFSTDLSALPKAEDIIIFKVPYRKANKNVNTDFMAGKVEYVQRRTKSIKILLMDGLSELCHVPKQLIFCNMDNSQDSMKYLLLKLNDMREAKLFSKGLKKNC